MARDRELIKLAGTLSADEIAHRFDASLPQVLKVAKRLGINLGPQPPRPDGRFKAKSK